MCVGENNAIQSVNYLNAQLIALWENSQGCVSRHSNGLQPDQNYSPYSIPRRVTLAYLNDRVLLRAV